jgi:hypothetical protein
MDPYAVAGLDSPDGAVEMVRGGDQLAGNDPIGDHSSVGIDVGKKGLERPYPLGDAGLDDLPFR